jgi:sugar/nucleoside kinase (ribokinase family)
VAVIRDQVPNRKDPGPYLDDISVPEWWSLLNRRSYFFANESDLVRLVRSYLSRGMPQEVITFNARR